MASTSNSVDPDIAAAFAGSTVASPFAGVDPDIAAAYGSSGHLEKWDGPPEPGLEGMETVIPKAAGAILNMPGHALTDLAVAHGVTNPYAAAAIGVIPDLAEDFALGGRQLIREGADLISSGALRAAPAEEAANSYAGAADAENARLSAIRANAENKGLIVPDSGTVEQFRQASITNQPLADQIVRQNFGLPDDAPLTPTMMASVRRQVASTGAYAQVRAIPSLQVSDDAVDALTELPAPVLKALNVSNRITADNTISGDDAVDLSRGLRAQSKRYWKSPNPTDQSVAENIDNATDAIENSVATHLSANGAPETAAQWQADRATIAQTYNVEKALRGGHVNVPNLTSQNLKGAPLSGDLEMLAELGDSHPEAFAFTRTRVAQPSLARRATAAAIPMITTPGGALLGSGLGPAGTAAGAVAGRSVGEGIAQRILGP